MEQTLRLGWVNKTNKGQHLTKGTVDNPELWSTMEFVALLLGTTHLYDRRLSSQVIEIGGMPEFQKAFLIGWPKRRQLLVLLRDEAHKPISW